MLSEVLDLIIIQVVPKKASIQIQISALIQATFCSALKFISLLKDECVKTHSFIQDN